MSNIPNCVEWYQNIRKTFYDSMKDCSYWENKSFCKSFWINSPNSNTYKCSVCGEEIEINKNLISLFKYCPMCGAKMDEKKCII